MLLRYTCASTAPLNLGVRRHTPTHPMQLTNRQRFWFTAGLAGAAQVLMINVLSEGVSVFGLSILVWNLVPIAVAPFLFLAEFRPAAWGWLTTVAFGSTWNSAAVLLSRNSTAVLGWFWEPIWAVTIVGPVGAAIAVLYARRRTLGH